MQTTHSFLVHHTHTHTHQSTEGSSVLFTQDRVFITACNKIRHVNNANFNQPSHAKLMKTNPFIYSFKNTGKTITVEKKKNNHPHTERERLLNTSFSFPIRMFKNEHRPTSITIKSFCFYKLNFVSSRRSFLLFIKKNFFFFFL